MVVQVVVVKLKVLEEETTSNHDLEGGGNEKEKSRETQEEEQREHTQAISHTNINNHILISFYVIHSTFCSLVMGKRDTPTSSMRYV